MAFGFTRQSGSGRGYINADNPLFAPGQRLSRRQYDKYVEQLGARTHAPGAGAIRDAERRIEALRDALAGQQAALDARAAELTRREMALAERERAAGTRAVFHKERTAAGLRRYRTLLEMYQDKQRAAGMRLNKREAARTPEFQSIVRAIRETDKSLSSRAMQRNPNKALAEQARRKAAFEKVGGAAAFREDYQRRFGRVAPVRRSEGFGARYRRVRGR